MASEIVLVFLAGNDAILEAIFCFRLLRGPLLLGMHGMDDVQGDVSTRTVLGAMLVYWLRWDGLSGSQDALIKLCSDRLTFRLSHTQHSCRCLHGKTPRFLHIINGTHFLYTLADGSTMLIRTESRYAILSRFEHNLKQSYPLPY